MKIRNVIKKFFALTAAGAMTVSLCACSNDNVQVTAQSQNVDGSQAPSDNVQQPSGEADYTIGICNYVDDASLNQINENIQARLAEIGEERASPSTSTMRTPTATPPS